MADSWAEWDLEDPAVIEAALMAQPLVAARLAARSKLPSQFVPFLQARTAPLPELFASLDATSMQLLQLAKFHRGVNRDVALAEAHDLDPAVLDRAARNLCVAGLASVDDGVLQVDGLVKHYVELQLPVLADYIDSITSDEIGRACKLFGVNGGTRKAERAAALLGALSDPDVLLASLNEAGPETAELLKAILEASLDPTKRLGGSRDEPAGAIDGTDLMDHRQLYSATRLSAYTYSYGRPELTRSPFENLVDRLVIGINPYSARGYSVWVWFEVLYAIHGNVFPTWPSPPTPTPDPIEDSSAQPVRMVAAITAMAEHLGTAPAEGKKTGDRRPPVRTWKAAAKARHVEPATAPLLGDLGLDMGLAYARLLPRQGRGNAAYQPAQWQPNPLRLAEFAERSAGERWLLVFDAWLSRIDDSGVAFHRHVSKRLLLAVLASLPERTGLGRADLDQLADYRHVALADPAVIDALLADMIALGLVPATGPIGLTSAGRAAADGAEAVDALLSGGTDTFVVQPDHSVIAPPDLSPAVATTLARYAELESEGGASVWRLSASRLALASTTTTADEVTAFFAEHSSVPVPGVVTRFIADAMVAVAPITVATVSCVITAEDPIVVADAARHKAAKLTVMAPGVATSTLGAAKVTEVLASKGVVLAGANVMGSEAGRGGRGRRSGGGGVEPSVGGPGDDGANVLRQRLGMPLKSTGSSNADDGGSGVAPARIADHAGWEVDQRDPNDPLAKVTPIVETKASAAEIGARLSRRPGAAKKKGKSNGGADGAGDKRTGGAKGNPKTRGPDAGGDSS